MGKIVGLGIGIVDGDHLTVNILSNGNCKFNRRGSQVSDVIPLTVTLNNVTGNNPKIFSPHL